jgi:hypothetical protein
LNYFQGKPIFGSAELRGAQTVSQWATESETNASWIRGIRDNVPAVHNPWSEADEGRDVEPKNAKRPNEYRDKIKPALRELNRTIGALLTMVRQGEMPLENDRRDCHADLIQNMVDGLDSLGKSFNRICVGMRNRLWQLPNPNTKSRVNNYLESIEQSVGVTLHTQNRPGSEIEGGTTDSCPEKRTLLEALKRDELPNNVA